MGQVRDKSSLFGLALRGRNTLILSEILDVGGVSTEFPEALLFEFDENGKIGAVDIYIKQPPRPA